MITKHWEDETRQARTEEVIRQAEVMVQTHKDSGSNYYLVFISDPAIPGILGYKMQGADDIVGLGPVGPELQNQAEVKYTIDQMRKAGLPIQKSM